VVGTGASGALSDAIARDFGSLDRWRAEFVAMGKAEGGGSGWVILSYSPRDKRLVNQWAADHTTTLAGGRPVLVLDMYEHAYHMDYGAAARALRRHLYGGNPLGQRREALRSVQPRKLATAPINWPALRRSYDGIRT